MLNELGRVAWNLITQNRRFLVREQRALLAGPGAPRSVLEIGSGKQRRGQNHQSAERFSGFETTFVMTDVDPSLGHRVLDVTQPDLTIGRFHLVLCCNVLEHVADIPAAIAGLSDLCSDDGMVFASTPFVYPYHDEPGDYWRPTAHGLRHSFEQRFGQVAVTWTGVRRFPFQVFVRARNPRR